MPDTIDDLEEVRTTLPVDISSEQLLSLPQAARRFPPYRRGRPVNPSTVWRWISSGVKLSGGRRVKLGAVRLSGRWLTSVEALARFIEAQTPDLGNGASLAADAAPETPRAENQRRRRSEKAGAKLKALGID